VAALEGFAARAQRRVGLRGEVAILITTSAQLRRLNRDFRGKDHPTDVLSFPSEAQGMAGDIAISRPIARRQAKALGHSLAIELKVLILHGMLHLAGHDHEHDRGEMAKLEARLRARFGLAHGLIERSKRSVEAPSPALRKKASAPARRTIKSSRKRPGQ